MNKLFILLIILILLILFLYYNKTQVTEYFGGIVITTLTDLRAKVRESDMHNGGDSPERWDVSNVTDMSNLFKDYVFSKPNSIIIRNNRIVV